MLRKRSERPESENPEETRERKREREPARKEGTNNR
jgi:hypothetical protein